MMERINSLTPRKQERKSDRASAREKPFKSVDVGANPWSLPRDNQDVIPITYGNIYYLARQLLESTDKDAWWLYLDKRQIKRFEDGRAFRIRLRSAHDLYLGGNIWLRDTKGRTCTVYDTKGLFQLNWRQLQNLYQSKDLATIMERTRHSLWESGELKPDQQAWDRTSAITGGLWRRLGIDLREVECVTAPRGPGNLQGYNVFGHTNNPVYFFDIHSAYLAEMDRFQALHPFSSRIWNVRQELKKAKDPAEHILKLAGTVMPGKFSSTLGGKTESGQYRNKYYRPILARTIRQRVNDRLTAAMKHIDPDHKRIRWCVDGFISDQDISKYLDIGEDLGQWKPVEAHPYLTIAQTNIWWTDNTHKNNGYLVTEQQVLDNPEEIHTSKKVFNWRTLEETEQPITLYQNHFEEECKACLDGGDLHDRLPNYIIPYRF